MCPRRTLSLDKGDLGKFGEASRVVSRVGNVKLIFGSLRSLKYSSASYIRAVSSRRTSANCETKPEPSETEYK